MLERPLTLFEVSFDAMIKRFGSHKHPPED
jgi:hypothetical protein